MSYFKNRSKYIKLVVGAGVAAVAFVGTYDWPKLSYVGKLTLGVFLMALLLTSIFEITFKANWIVEAPKKVIYLEMLLLWILPIAVGCGFALFLR